jgi:hypothetical protein
LTVEARRDLRPAGQWAILGAYILLIVVVSFYHEMWRDEVRAFSVATTLPSWGALVGQLRFEGHPILWYAVLRLGFAATHSHLVLPIAALAFASAAAFLLLRFAPFPVWLRILALFGAFLGYELSVSPRNYGIGVMLMMFTCLAYRRRKGTPILLAVCLLLLANTSIHGTLAALVFLFYWLLDAFDSTEPTEIVSARGVIAIALVLSGIGFAIYVSRPSPEMAWAVSLDSLSYQRVLRSIFMDPGIGLRGYAMTSITAVSELPWRYTPVDSGIATRIIVDVCVAWLLWSLRGNLRAIVAIVVTIIGFSVFFRNVYTAGLRHEGVVLFLIFAICWIDAERKGNARRIALGLLPLFALQSLALPMLIHREITYPRSSSKAYGEFIRSHSQYANAVLMSEPDYHMESMPYYVNNRVFMPRQREFTDRVHFDSGVKRQNMLSLDELLNIADSVACSTKAPVLVSIGYPDFQFLPTGAAYPLYRGLSFTWSAPEWTRLGAPRPLVAFSQSTTDEVYRIYERRCP